MTVVDKRRTGRIVWFGNAQLTPWAEPNWLSRFYSLFRRRRKKHRIGDFQFPALRQRLRNLVDVDIPE